MDYKIFNMRTAVKCTRLHTGVGCTDTVRECALKTDSGRKIPCRTEESNLCQRRHGSMLYRLSCIPTPFPGRSHRIPQYIWSCRENSSVHMVTSVHVVVQTEYLSTCGRAGRIPLVVQKKKTSVHLVVQTQYLSAAGRANKIPQYLWWCRQNTSVSMAVQTEYLSTSGRADTIPQHIWSCRHNTSVHLFVQTKIPQYTGSCRQNTSVHLVVQTQYLSISIVQTQYLSTSGRVQTLAHYIRSQ